MKTASYNSLFKPIRRILGFEPADWQRHFKAKEMDDVRSRTINIMHSVDPASIGHVELLTRIPLKLYQALDWLHKQKLHAVVSDKMFVNPGTSTIIIDIDSFGDIKMCIKFLMNIRLDQPNLKVIAFSEKFDRDDWSTELLQVADICTHFPTTFSRLDFALSEAEINNEVWQDRCRAAERLTD